MTIIMKLPSSARQTGAKIWDAAANRKSVIVSRDCLNQLDWGLF